MRVQLFGVGTKSSSPAITAQRRINCHVDIRKEQDRTQYAIVGRPGLKNYLTDLGIIPTRGIWPVNTLSLPLQFVVQGSTLFSVDNGGAVTVLGALATISGNVSMADDGTYLVIVDGTFGYVYNMVTATLTTIVDGNFTTSPTTVTWQDNYFIVTSSSSTRQWQLSQISPGVDPTVWPANQIGFAGSGGGKLQAGVADHSILELFGDVYTEFWQDSGSPDLPYSKIPGATQQFGLAAPASISQFDNSLAGLFQDRTGALNVSRMSGFSLKKLSDSDIEFLLKSYTAGVADALGFGFTVGGHPLYMLNLPKAQATHVYDGLSNTWVEYQSFGHDHFRCTKFSYFLGKLYMCDHHNGNIYIFDPDTYDDASDPISMEVVSKHIWNDDKFIGISQLQVDFQSGVGLATGQGSDPLVDLQVSKDGGNSFFSVGYEGIGKIGEFTQRVMWGQLGAARDWVLKLVVTDPVKRVITGASCEMVGGPF